MNPTAIVSRTNEFIGQRSRYVLSLARAHEVHLCGGKASNLARMIDLKVSVPLGFVVTSFAFQELLDFNQIRQPIEELLCDVDVSQTEDLGKIASEIRRTILSATIPDNLWQEIQFAREQLLACTPVAVRSSAIGEDSIDDAFAGQLDTFLNVQSNASLVESLLACWASYWSQRSLFYQHSRGIRLQGMAVIVQQMIQSRIAGVLFTRNPQAGAGDVDSLIVEYCYGQGEQLVSGNVNPGRVSINRHTLTCRRLAVPQQPTSSTAELLLDDHQLEQLARVGMQLENDFRCPQDIEWTIDENRKIYLVQSRPITALRNATELASGETVLWSNANVNENYPDAISPLLYSIASSGYYYYFRNLGLAIGLSRARAGAMEYPLRSIIGVHGARMYYNLSNIHACLRMAPCGELLVGSFNQFVGTSEVASTNGHATWKSYRRSRASVAMELCRIALRGTWQFARLSRRVAEFERTVDQFASRTRPKDLKNRSRQELLVDLRSFLHIRCHCWIGASLADAAAMLSYTALKGFLNREFPDQDLSGLHHSLLKGLRDIVSSAPIADLWALSRTIRENSNLVKLFTDNSAESVLDEVRRNPDFRHVETGLDEFLENWGYRCSGELMLTVPSYQENQSSLVELLQAYVKLDHESPIDRLREQQQQRERETSRVLRQISKRKHSLSLPRFDKAILLKTLLKCAHTSIALRERARLKQALLYSRIRLIALAIGNQLVRSGQIQCASDVFYLTHQELAALLSGSAMFPNQVGELVDSRKKSHTELRAMCLPDAFELPAGSYWHGEPLLDHGPSEQPSTSGRLELAGVGACSGKVTARAAILNDVSECRLLSKGDVLVARQTDPGWGPVFFLISGLVLERGGMLSHGAILAREYGIPTVVGIAGAVERIKTGTVVEVDGDCGDVRLLA
jgi:pyruvate,water dikinase